MKIHEVGPETLHLVEPLLARWLASKHCLHAREEIMSKVESCAWTMWAVVKGRDVLALYAVHISETPRGRVLELPFLVGHGIGKYWPMIDEHIGGIAKKYDASAIAITGRLGWARMLRTRYTPYHITLVREVA